MIIAPQRLGIAGLGTIGVGVLKMTNKNASLISLRTGRDVTVLTSKQFPYTND